MPLLYHWRRENYAEDIRNVNPAAGLELEQNSPTFAEAAPGERLWAFTRRQDGVYVLVGQLHVAAIEEAPGAQYGRFRVVPADGTTVLYDAERGEDAEDVIRSLSIRVNASVLGQSFQGASAVRKINVEDDKQLESFAAGLPVLLGPGGLPDEEDARFWRALLRNAEGALASGTLFESPKLGKPYRVATVEPEKVTIQRVDTPGTEVLTRGRFYDVMGQIREAGGRVQRRTLFYTVAKEAMLVALHPALHWDSSGDSIEFRPESEKVRPLRLHEDYSRREVHDIFAPETPFTPQAGTWGLQGIVRIPERPGDYVFFVTFGQQQGEHVFEEGVTEDGVLTWQSQPQQALNSSQIQQFIAHDETQNSIYLFLRTRPGRDYTYLGRLKYLSHDRDREKPVHFKWQILDEEIPAPVADRIGLELQPHGEPGGGAATPQRGLVQAAPPVVAPAKGEPTPSFRGRRRGDYAEQDAKNRKLGHAGELLVLEREREVLRAAGREDLVHKVRHTSVLIGDGAGYDIESVTLDGTPKYIEVKTTRGSASTPFFMSRNELAFATLHPKNYYLYRVYDFQADPAAGQFYVMQGNPESRFECTPIEYRLRILSTQPV